ncbi:MAG: HAD-IA family hydrolase [Pseudomonadota bacterium]
MSRRGAIFDLDGTLADTSADLLNAANAALEPRGLPLLSLEDDRAYAGRGGRSMIRRSMTLAGIDLDDEAGVRLTDAIYPELLEAYVGALAVHTVLFPGVEACLDALDGDGWALGVCTNKPERMAISVLDALGVLNRFEALLGADTLTVRKPDPEHVRVTAQRCGVDPLRCVMIGDTSTDLNAARAAGIPCVLTRFGFAAEPLEDLAPDAIIDGYAELPGVARRLVPAAATA